MEMEILEMKNTINERKNLVEELNIKFKLVQGSAHKRIAPWKFSNMRNRKKK